MVGNGGRWWAGKILAVEFDEKGVVTRYRVLSDDDFFRDCPASTGNGEQRSSVKITERTYEERVPVSELCEELSLRPTVFYRWQKELFENGAAAFQAQERPHRQVEEKQKRIEFLEKKVQAKDEVLAELMAEHIALKKSLGEL
jgi:hypothetical protein